MKWASFWVKAVRFVVIFAVCVRKSGDLRINSVFDYGNKRMMM